MATRFFKALLIAPLALTAAALDQTVAYAGTPVVHACVGQSISSAATGSSGFGHFVSGVAHDPTSGSRIGIGDDLKALEAGQVPDVGFPNTCNG